MKGILHIIFAILVISPCSAQGNISYKVELLQKKEGKRDTIVVSDLMERVFFEISNIESDLTFSENLAVFKNASGMELDNTSPARQIANTVCGTDDTYFYDLLGKKELKIF